jgi:predicted DNA-binding protein (MmcQ/YjbR family)
MEAAVRRAGSLDSNERTALSRLRRVTDRLPQSREALSFGHPAFEVLSKAYAVLDRYEGAGCLWLRVDPMEREALLVRPGWFPSPHDPGRAALCCRIDALDWRRAGRLIRMSYALALLKAPSRRPR